MQRIDEKREASGQNAMLEQVRTWQQEQDTEPDKYAVFDTMSADWGGEEDGFVLYEIPEEYSRTGGYFPEKMQVYTYCVCKQYGVRYRRCRGQEIPSNSGDHSQEIQGTGSHCTDETGGNTGLFFQRFAVVYIPHNHDIAGR